VGTIFFLVVTMPLSSLVCDLAKIPGFMSLQENPLGSVVALESLNRFYNLNDPLMIVTMILLVIGIEGLFRYDSQLCSLLLFMMLVPAALGIVLSYWIAFEPQYALLFLSSVCLGVACSYLTVYLLLSRWITISRMKVLVLFLLLFGAMSLPLV